MVENLGFPPGKLEIVWGKVYNLLFFIRAECDILIKIVNPVDENFNLDIIKENKTTKEDKENHGFGLITINNIISKYNGNIEYSIDNKMLIVDITLLSILDV